MKINKEMIRKTARGFTLVELLIVIALIGVLAVAVLAAINPIEQLNRARDTGMESDAAQLLSAIDRFYATQEKFPWVFQVNPACGGNCKTSNDAAFGFYSAQDIAVGICGDAANPCVTNGILLSNIELKTEFRNRNFIKALVTNPTGMLYIGKDLATVGVSPSVYACWVPTSNAKRAKATWSIAVGTATRTPGCDPALAGRTWADLANSCVYCIPQ